MNLVPNLDYICDITDYKHDTYIYMISHDTHILMKQGLLVK